MNDLLRSQIHENCKLALPEGLKDLINDISREVLRAQPQNLYQFIANYLGALLEARETLTIASHVCTNICKCACEPIESELYVELRKIGLDDEDLENAVKVIDNHLKGNQKTNELLKETKILLKLLRTINIDEIQLDAVQRAIQKAFKKRLGHRDFMDVQDDDQESTDAVHHTLQLHKHKNQETKELFVASNFKPYVTTVSSTSLAGSYVRLPKYRPYSAHDSVILSAIPEKEHVSIDYTKAASTSELKPNRVKINDEKTDVPENTENSKATVLFGNDKYMPKDRDTPDRIGEGWFDETVGTDEATELSDDYEDDDTQYTDDEVEESIDNIGSGNESSASSIVEFSQDDIDQ